MTSPTFDPGFTTPALAATFSPAARVAAMCRFEAALARASADAGILPTTASDAIVAACARGVDDPDEVVAQGWESGTPVLGLLERLRTGLDPEAGTWLHHGATTQDVVDTATMVLLVDALAAIRADMVVVAAGLRARAVDHRDTPTTAQTFLQPADPTTVGLRVAGWLSPITTQMGQVRTTAASLPVQLGGPTGTLAALGGAGDVITRAVAAQLGLVAPTLPWHTDRTVVATLVALLERIARTMATISTDLALLAHDGEVSMRAGASSSMPDKRNPIDAIRAIAAAEACSGVAGTVTHGRPHELERGVGGWHAEWFAVPLVCHTAGAAVAAVGRAVAGLEFAPSQAGPGATSSSGLFVDRVVAACDAEVAR